MEPWTRAVVALVLVVLYVINPTWLEKAMASMFEER